MADNSKQGFGGGGATVPNRVYEDFDPHLEWAKDETFDTLLVYLPGKVLFFFFFSAVILIFFLMYY